MRRLSGFFVILLSFYSGWLWMDYRAFTERRVVNAWPVVVEIARGEGSWAIAEHLAQVGIIDRPLWFWLEARLRGVSGRLKYGEYEVPPHLTQAQVLDLLVAGKIKQYALTIPEGWRLAQVLELIAAQPKLAQDLGEQSGAELMARLGSPELPPEGWFYPDTYLYHKGMSACDLLRRAHHRMREVLTREWQDRAPDLPLVSPDQALILASIVEKETALPEERPQIAGVFLRRLSLNMPLQTDPTVIYGMGAAYEGDIRKEDLRQDTAYNTYVHRGLPPTPIALPGLAAIRAVLHPAPGDSLYFVARGDGGHVFSATFEEHQRAVALYQQRHQ